MFKKSLGVFISGLLKLSLFGLALAGAGWLTFGTPDNVKRAADDSKLYAGIADASLEAAIDEIKTGTRQDIPVDDPVIREITADTFNADTFKENSQSIIDSVYAWLQGETDKPEFSVSLEDQKNQFVDSVSDYAASRYEALPICTPQQLRTINPNTIDPFNAPCRVPQIGSQTVRQRVSDEIVVNDFFVNNTAYTADNLPKDEQGRTILDYASAAPDAYRAFSLLPWILGIVSVVLAGLILALQDDKRRALKTIGITLVGTGIFLAIGSLIISWSFSQMNPPVESTLLQNSIVEFVKTLTGAYNRELMKFYLVYLLGGVGILATLWYQNKNRSGAPEHVTQKQP